MYELNDTFNGYVISRHRTLDAAVKKSIAHDRAVKRANGRDSYIPTIITFDGEEIYSGDMLAAQQRVHCAVR